MLLKYSVNSSSRTQMSLEILRSLKSRQENTQDDTQFANISKKQICAVGWEPNPATTEYLKKLEASYEKCGFRLKINTETGVGIQNSELKFVRMSQVYLQSTSLFSAV